MQTTFGDRDISSTCWRWRTGFPRQDFVGNRFVEVASQAIGQTLARLVGDTDGTAALLGDYFETWARGGAPFCASSIMVRRDVALATGGFPFGHNRGEDLAFQARMAFRAPVAAGSYVGCLYRRTPANLRRMPVREADIAMHTIGERLRRQPPDDAARRLALSEFADRLAIGHALDCLVHDDVAAARRFLATARGTQWQRRRWLIANVLAGMPGPLRRAAIALADKARALGTGSTVN